MAALRPLNLDVVRSACGGWNGALPARVFASVGVRLPLLLLAFTRRIDHGRAIPFENGTSAVQTFARTRLAIISAKMFFPASDSMAVMNI